MEPSGNWSTPFSRPKKKWQNFLDYVIRFIADQGVKHVFLVTGGGAMHLNESARAAAPILSQSVTPTNRPVRSVRKNYGKATNTISESL